MFRTFKTILTAGALLLACAVGGRAATTRYVELRSTLQPNTTGLNAIFVGSGTVQNLRSSTITATVGTITALNSTTIAATSFTATTQFLGPNGSLQTPSYSFTNDTKTGLARTGPQTIDVVVGGTRTVQFDNALNTNVYGHIAMQTAGKQILANDGTLAAPAVSFNNDPDNGTRLTGTNAWTNVAGGVDVASFTTTGSSLKGTTTNDSAAIGWVGEYVSSATTNTTGSPGTAQLFDIVSISLTAGDWDLAGMVCSTLNGATSTTFDGGISSTAGNSGTGLSYGDTRFQTGPPTSGYDNCGSLPRIRKSISGTTTFYLKALLNFSAGTPKAYGGISARRVR